MSRPQIAINHADFGHVLAAVGGVLTEPTGDSYRAHEEAVTIIRSSRLGRVPSTTGLAVDFAQELTSIDPLLGAALTVHYETTAELWDCIELPGVRLLLGEVWRGALLHRPDAAAVTVARTTASTTTVSDLEFSGTLTTSLLARHLTIGLFTVDEFTVALPNHRRGARWPDPSDLPELSPVICDSVRPLRLDLLADELRFTPRVT